MAVAKEALDYFYVECKESLEETMLVRKYGDKGTSILIYLQRYIFGFKGYYATFDDKLKKYFEIYYDILEDELSEFVETCIEYGVFDKKLFENHNILTSENLQKKYAEAVKRRKSVTYMPEYKLIKTNE